MVQTTQTKKSPVTVRLMGLMCKGLVTRGPVMHEWEKRRDQHASATAFILLSIFGKYEAAVF